MEPNTTPVQEPGASMTKPMLIGGAVIAAFVLGGIVFWQMPLTQDTQLSSASDVDSETWLPASSGSDEAAAIQAELEATNMADFESEMQTDAEASASSL